MGKLKLGVFVCLRVRVPACVLCVHVCTHACVLGDCAQQPRTDPGTEGLPCTTGLNIKGWGDSRRVTRLTPALYLHRRSSSSGSCSQGSPEVTPTVKGTHLVMTCQFCNVSYSEKMQPFIPNKAIILGKKAESERAGKLCCSSPIS